MGVGEEKGCRIVIASTNAHKVGEIAEILRGLNIPGLQVDALNPEELLDVEETGETFEANAALKACAYSKALGCLALADDSGLEVDALQGAPGVHSARYAGEPCDDAANNDKLLRALAGTPEEKRGARYQCVIALADGDRIVASGRGSVEGRIAATPAGKGGFGYDPLFFHPPLGQTFGEADPAEKHRRSHRFHALRDFAQSFSAWWRNSGVGHE